MTDNAANMKHAFELMLADDVVESVDSEDDDEPDSVLGQWKLNKMKIEGWLGCSAHQLQLVVNDSYMELRGYHRIQNILSKTRAISSQSWKSSHFAYSLSQKIPVPCETRWNSYFRLYKHLFSSLRIKLYKRSIEMI